MQLYLSPAYLPQSDPILESKELIATATPTRGDKGAYTSSTYSSFSHLPKSRHLVFYFEGSYRMKFLIEDFLTLPSKFITYSLLSLLKMGLRLVRMLIFVLFYGYMWYRSFKGT